MLLNASTPPVPRLTAFCVGCTAFRPVTENEKETFKLSSTAVTPCCDKLFESDVSAPVGNNCESSL